MSKDIRPPHGVPTTLSALGPRGRNQPPSTPASQQAGTDISMSGIQVPQVANEAGPSQPQACGLAAIRARRDAMRLEQRQKELDAQGKGRGPPSPGPDQPSKKPQTQKPTEEEMPDADSALDEGKAKGKGKEKAKEPFPFSEIVEYSRMSCAVRYEEGPVIGTASRKGKEWTPTFRLEAGKLGVPKITLTFSPGNKEEGEDDSETTGQTPSTTLTWYPGALADDTDKYMMNSLTVLAVAGQVDTEMICRPEVLKDFPEKDLPRLISFSFTAQDPFIQDYKPDLWADAIPSIRNTLESLCHPGGNLISIWFRVPTSTNDIWHQNCFRHFLTCYGGRLPPLHQYYNQAKEIVLDLKETEDVKTIGNGMYAVWPTKKVKGQKIDDRSGEPDHFKTLPTTLWWPTPEEFLIYAALTPIRESQFQRGLMVHVGMQPSRIFVNNMPKFTASSETKIAYQDLTKDQRQFQEYFKVYVRQPGQGSTKEAAPVEGSRSKLAWDNSDSRRNQPHRDPPGWWTWFGEIVRVPLEELKATGTDFCCMMRKAKGGPKMTGFDVLENKPDEVLPIGWMEITYDDSASLRELMAVRELMASKRPEIIRIREVLWRQHLGQFSDSVDMSWGPNNLPMNHERYEAFMDNLKKGVTLNRGQIEGVELIEDSPNGLGCVVGPGGTGKTTTMVQAVLAHAEAGSKQLVCAGANVAVDTDTNAIYKAIPAHMSIKMLRYETGSLSAKEIREQDTSKFVEAEVDAPAPIKAKRTFEADPAYIGAAAKIMADSSASLIAIDRFLEEAGSFQDAYEMMQSSSGKDFANVPLETTMNYHVDRLTKEDVLEVMAEDERTRAKNPLGVIDTPAAERSRSAAYVEILKIYIAADGELKKAVRDKFWEERLVMENRVALDVDIILPTANNCGAALAATDFNPRALHFDDSGQLTIAGFYVPLTTFKGWMAVYMYGDPEQLHPPVLGARVNEVALNSKISPLGLVLYKGCDHKMLRTQYRMCAAISEFPNAMWYNGQLINAPSVLADNIHRQRMRAVSKEFYKVKGHGSEFWVVDVVYGRARLEDNGFSIQNHANAAAIALCMKRCIAAGIREDQIHIISLYRGQRKVVISKITETADGQYKLMEWATVDSFQSRQGDMIFLDVVAANQIATDAGKGPRAAEDGTDAGPEHVSFGTVTGHVTNANRWCVALTRARWGHVTFCQAASLSKSMKPKAGRKRNVAALMVVDARKRGLLYTDYEHLDTHPEAIKETKIIGAQQAAANRAKEVEQSFHWIGKSLKQAKDIREPKAFGDIDVYKRPVKDLPAVKARSTHNVGVPDFGFKLGPLGSGQRAEKESGSKSWAEMVADEGADDGEIADESLGV